jgi:hypothetical protein
MMTTIWMWAKRIGAALILIGAAILGFVLARRKSDPVKEPDAIKLAEDKLKEDQAKIEAKDQEIHAKEEEIQHTSDAIKEKIKENEDKPPKPGDAGQAADDFLNAIGGNGGDKK